jgi:hypothetical protein
MYLVTATHILTLPHGSSPHPPRIPQLALSTPTRRRCHISTPIRRNISASPAPPTLPGPCLTIRARMPARAQYPARAGGASATAPAAVRACVAAARGWARQGCVVARTYLRCRLPAGLASRQASSLAKALLSCYLTCLKQQPTNRCTTTHSRMTTWWMGIFASAAPCHANATLTEHGTCECKAGYM